MESMNGKVMEICAVDGVFFSFIRSEKPGAVKNKDNLGTA
jgi:hypothetical protein